MLAVIMQTPQLTLKEPQTLAWALRPRNILMLNLKMASQKILAYLLVTIKFFRKPLLALSFRPRMMLHQLQPLVIRLTKVNYHKY